MSLLDLVEITHSDLFIASSLGTAAPRYERERLPKTKSDDPDSSEFRWHFVG